MIEFKTKGEFFINKGDIHFFWSTDNDEAQMWELHGHEFFELELFTGGRGYQILNGERYEIEKGSIHLLTSSDFHEMYWEAGIDQIGIRFDPSQIDKAIIEKIFSAGHALVYKLDGAEYDLIHKMLTIINHSETDDSFPLRDIFIGNMLQSIILMLLRKEAGVEAGTKRGRNHVQRAIAYLEMHFKDDPGLDEVADFVGLNGNYFSGIFKKETGKSFVRYLIDLKLEYSRNLIRSSRMTINEICFNSGFNSFSNFAREFKKKYGITPLQYRKK